MDISFDKIHINKFQLKILKLLIIYENLNIYQIHGYFKFPDFTNLLIYIQDLQNLNLIHTSEIFSDKEFYISLHGKKYLHFYKQKQRKSIYAILGATASFIAIINFVLTLLSN